MHISMLIADYYASLERQHHQKNIFLEHKIFLNQHNNCEKISELLKLSLKHLNEEYFESIMS